jgi:3-methyladenine DNA glycosylase AlkD
MRVSGSTSAALPFHWFPTASPDSMTVAEVLTLLDSERDQRGMENWAKLGARPAGMRSYGIGLTRLRRLAKQIGRNRELAQALWTSDVYDARIIALLIDVAKHLATDRLRSKLGV